MMDVKTLRATTQQQQHKVKQFLKNRGMLRCNNYATLCIREFFGGLKCGDVQASMERTSAVQVVLPTLVPVRRRDLPTHGEKEPNFGNRDNTTSVKRTTSSEADTSRRAALRRLGVGGSSSGEMWTPQGVSQETLCRPLAVVPQRSRQLHRSDQGSTLPPVSRHHYALVS